MGLVQSFIIKLIARRARPSYFGFVEDFKIISFVLSSSINGVGLINNLELTKHVSFMVVMVIMPFIIITSDKLNSSSTNYRLKGSYSYSDKHLITIVHLLIY